MVPVAVGSRERNFTQDSKSSFSYVFAERSFFCLVLGQLDLVVFPSPPPPHPLFGIISLSLSSKSLFIDQVLPMLCVIKASYVLSFHLAFMFCAALLPYGRQTSLYM